MNLYFGMRVARSKERTRVFNGIRETNFRPKRDLIVDFADHECVCVTMCLSMRDCYGVLFSEDLPVIWEIVLGA